MQEIEEIIENDENYCTKETSRWCNVTQCDFQGNRSLFHFPKDKNLCKKWATKCKIGKNVTAHMFVCAAHFVDYDFYPLSPSKLFHLVLQVIIFVVCINAIIIFLNR